jgi:hypothetical protein
MGIDGNEIAYQSARQGSTLPLIGPEPALGRSAEVAKGVIRGWTSRKHKEYWQSLCGKGRLRAFLKDCLLKDLGDYSTGADTS